MAATQKMIDYAKGIADIIGVDYPDFSDYKSTSIFISENAPKYKEILYKETKNIISNSVNNKISKLGLNKLSTNFYDFVITLENVKGVYMFWEDSTLMYVGKSVNLAERVLTSLEERISVNNHINKCSIILCETEADMHILEIVLITELKPKLNKDCACNDFSNHFTSGFSHTELLEKSYCIFERDK